MCKEIEVTKADKIAAEEITTGCVDNVEQVELIIAKAMIPERQNSDATISKTLDVAIKLTEVLKEQADILALYKSMNEELRKVASGVLTFGKDPEELGEDARRVLKRCAEVM